MKILCNVEINFLKKVISVSFPSNSSNTCNLNAHAFTRYRRKLHDCVILDKNSK